VWVEDPKLIVADDMNGRGTVKDELKKKDSTSTRSIRYMGRS
jgi:hypothetical protein